MGANEENMNRAGCLFQRGKGQGEGITRPMSFTG